MRVAAPSCVWGRGFEVGHDWRQADGPIHHYQKRRSDRQNKARGGGGVLLREANQSWDISVVMPLSPEIIVSFVSASPPPRPTPINHCVDRSCKSREPVLCHLQASSIYQPGSTPVSQFARGPHNLICFAILSTGQATRATGWHV